MANSILACRSCLRRALQGPLAMRVAQPIPIIRPLGFYRKYSGAAMATPQEDRSKDISENEIHKSIKDAPRTLDFDEKFDPDDTLAADRRRQSLEKKVKSRLMHIDDPFHVAQSVFMLLGLGRWDEALLLTETASRTMEVTASWNALIKHMLDEQKVRPAVKLFNDMKKRAIFPNEHTYTILFRGLAKVEDTRAAMPVAVKHWEILMNDSRLSPNTTHFNAVLHCCSRHKDLDRMFLIAASLNETTRKPDATTYTTILNGIRWKMLADMEDMTDADAKLAYQNNMKEKAKGLWDEVIDKWHKGALDIDEQTVGAMMQMLAEDVTKKNTDVAGIGHLLEQTMNIPNYAVNPGANADQTVESIPQTLARKKKQKFKYVTPGPRTLRLILEFTGLRRRSQLSVKYWNKLVNDFKVVPDADCYFKMLVGLKLSKSSSQILNVLQMREKTELHAGHFVLGLETCIMDNINPNAVSNATRIFKMATETLDISDATLPNLYSLCLRTSLVSHFHFRTLAKKGEKELTQAREKYGRQILATCLEMWEPYKALAEFWLEDGYLKGKNGKKMRRRDIYPLQRDTIAFLRHLYSALNKLMFENMLPAEALEQVRPMSAAVNRHIQLFYSQNPSSNKTSISSTEEAKDQEMDKKLAELEAANSGGADFDTGIKRLGAEFVWNTKAEMGPAKGFRGPTQERDNERPYMGRGGQERPDRRRFDGDRPSRGGREGDRPRKGRGDEDWPRSRRVNDDRPRRGRSYGGETAW